jgi:MFS family permease
MGLLVGSVLVAALAGLLFGFDTAVIAGLTGDLTRVMDLTPAALGITVSSALWGTLLGALAAGVPGDRFGSRACLRGLALLYIASGLGCALASGWGMLLLFRFIGGRASGGSSVLAPVYIAELAPPRRRGAMTGLFQLNVVAGILVAYLSNSLID